MRRPTTDLGWMDAHGRVLFTRDDRGDLLRTNEPGSRPAPRYWWGRTAEGDLHAFRADVPEPTRRLVEAARPAGPSSIREVLERDAPIERAWRGPAFRFPTEIAAEAIDAIRRIGPEEVGMLRVRFLDLALEVDERQPCVAWIVEGAAVSVASAARADAVCVEAGIETALDHRGRGHATRVVAAWARTVREGGREPLYSTSWENAASLAVAARLGLVRYGEDVHFT